MGLFSKLKGEKASAAAPAPPPAPVQTGKGFDPNTLKMQLKCAKNRMALQKNKLQNNVDKAEREVATLLGEKSEGAARTKTEQAIRDMLQLESLELLEPYCDMLLARVVMMSPQMEPMDNMPVELREAICSLAYASARVNNQELIAITEMMRAKYGAENINMVVRAEGPFSMCINPHLVRKMNVTVPEGFAVLQRLEKIAARFEVDWKPPAEENLLRNKSVMDHGLNQQPTLAPIEPTNIPGYQAGGGRGASGGGGYPPPGGMGGGYHSMGGGYSGGGGGGYPTAGGGGYPPAGGGGGYPPAGGGGGYPPAGGGGGYPPAGGGGGYPPAGGGGGYPPAGGGGGGYPTAGGGGGYPHVGGSGDPYSGSGGYHAGGGGGGGGGGYPSAGPPGGGYPSAGGGYPRAGPPGNTYPGGSAPSDGRYPNVSAPPSGGGDIPGFSGDHSGEYGGSEYGSSDPGPPQRPPNTFGGASDSGTPSWNQTDDLEARFRNVQRK